MILLRCTTVTLPGIVNNPRKRPCCAIGLKWPLISRIKPTRGESPMGEVAPTPVLFLALFSDDHTFAG